MLRTLPLAVALLLAAPPAPAATLEPTHATAHFRFYGTEGTENALSKLVPIAEDRLQQLCAQLGVCRALTRPIEVYIAEDAVRFARSLPPGSAMAEWAVGVAFPAEQRIVLRSHGTAFFSLRETFDHELSHVLLRRLAGQTRLPRWFVEGVAIWQAGESVLQRLHSAQGAAITDSLLPLASLDQQFPARGPAVSLAYAQSALFVRWLERSHGPRALGQLFARLGDGQPFDGAFRAVFGSPLAVLEARWAEDLATSTTPLVLLRDGSIIWIAMALLFIVAAITRMRQRRAQLYAMGEHEEVDDAWADLEASRDAGQPPTLH